MEPSLDHTISLLALTPATLDALLRDLPEKWTHATEGGNSWSVFDVVGHLIHAERTDWIPRALVILRHGETRPFAPFDREGHTEKFRASRWRSCWMSSPACAPRTSSSCAPGNSSRQTLPSADGIPRLAASPCLNCWLPGQRTT